MTHAEAIRKAAIHSQRGAASFHNYFRSKSMEGDRVLAVFYSRLAAEYSELARALMGIEGGEE